MDTLARDFDSIVSVLYRSAVDQDMWTTAIDQLVGYLSAEGGVLISNLASTVHRFSIVSTDMRRSRPELRRLKNSVKNTCGGLGEILIESTSSDTGAYQFINIGNEFCCGVLVLKYKCSTSAISSKYKVNSLHSHLSGAFYIACKFRERSVRLAGLRTVLDRSSVGLCALDCGGGVIYKNAKATMIIESEKCIHVNDSGRLSSNKNDLDQGMQQTLSLVVSTSSISDQTLFVGAANSKRLILEYSSLLTHGGRKQKSKGDVCVLVSFTELDTEPRVDIEKLAELCRLTRSEKAVAALFIAGYTNHQVAAFRRVSVETIKSQSRAISEKTQTFSRVELMRFAMKFISFLS